MHVEATHGFSGPPYGRARKPLRKSGLDAVGNVPWGTHFCQFYATGEDLLDILAPFFMAGLEANEFCFWVASHPLGVEAAKSGLSKTAPGFERFLAEGRIEIVGSDEWYGGAGGFDAERVLRGWLDKLDVALERGFDGLRVTGNTFWLEKDDWESFALYEAEVGSVIGSRRILALCTYSLEKCGAPEILDVIANHDFALIRRDGRWQSVKSLAYHRAQQALSESEERFRLLVDGVRDYAIFMLDPEGGIVSWNDGAERIQGWSADEVVGRHFSLLYPGAEGRADLQFAATHGVFKDEGELVRKDGSTFHAEVQITPLCDDEGRLRGYAKVIRDVTERRRAERELTASEARLRATIEGAVDGIVAIDERGAMLSLNSAALRLFGYDLSESIGQNVKMLMPEPVRSEHDFYLAIRSELQGAPTSGEGREVVGQRKDGSTFPLELTISEANCDGRRIFIGFLRDLTERRKTEARMQKMRAERLDLMAQMATGVAHEVNQPLSAIATYLSTARRLLPRPETSAAQVDAILESAAVQVMRAGQIIGHLRSFITRGEPDKTLQSLHEVIQDACDFADVSAKTAKVDVMLRLQAEFDRVIIDRVQIQQVLVNLKRNAIEAMHASEKRELVVATSLAGEDLIRTDISDTGAGLSEESLSNLFEPFTTTKAHGLGVGLSISRSIVEAHYGKLWAEPNPGGGAILSFTLPLAREDQDRRGQLALDP